MVKDKYDEFITLTFAYGARDEKVSLEISKKLSLLAGAKYKIIKLPWREEFAKTAGSALTSPGKTLPYPKLGDLGDLKKSQKTAKSVWVPARNLVFLSIAASFSEALGGYTDIITGFDKEEAASFPDNSELFVENLNKVLETAVLQKNVKVLAPLIEMDKKEIAKTAIKLGVPVKYSVSCYNPLGIDQGMPVHCGRCESCLRRLRAFKGRKEDFTQLRIIS
jgi:7-cyano-7-deazaguanine synthase